MATPSNRETVEKYWQAVNARDWAVLAQLLGPDYVWEMPQSGERVRGEQSWTVLRITGTGDDYISESRVSYPDGSVWHAVDIFHFRDGKIRNQVAYFASTLEAPEWRARWVERC